jgi:signal transduction histidine kinase
MSEAHMRLKELQRQEAVRQVREAVWAMRQPADLQQVLTVIREQLVANQFLFDDVGVGVVEQQGVGFLVRHYNYTCVEGVGQWVSWTDEPTDDLHPIHRFWQEGKVVYRPDLTVEDPFQEVWYFPPLTRCVVDVAFSHGTLALNSHAPNAFSADDIELLEELAVVLSEGFKRLDDLQQLEQRAQEAEALASAIDAVYSYTDLEQRLQEIVRQVRERIEAQRCILLLYDQGTGMLVPQAQEGYKEAVLQMRIAPEEGLSGHVYATGKAYFNRSLPDPQLKPLSAQNQVLMELTITGSSMGPSAGVPLKLGGQVIGAVVAGLVGRSLGERDLLLLERLAAQASLAIERSRQKRELELNLALQRVRNQILEMQEEADWEQVLFSLHRELSGLVEFWFCSIQFIDQQTGQYTFYTTHLSPEDWHLKQGQECLPLTPSLRQVVQTGLPLYRHTRAEVEHFQDPVGPEVQCIVDVPFSGGAVSINSIRENAFRDQDLAVLERFSQVISEGYRRLRDLRDLAQTRQRLQQAQKLEAVGQLTAGIAHNFNNLLQANLGSINLAMMKSPAEVQEYLQDADAAAMRGAELVRQLMLFARAEVKAPHFQTVDLGIIIGNTVSLCRKTIDRHIELQVDIAPDLPLVRVDASQLEQVLLNLYLNARDALEEAERLAPCIRTAARVALGARQGEGREGDYVCIEVSDNGTGMDAQTRERLFEPFFTTKEVGKGTGLGLATAYGILQRHQGWIECRSQEGQGTTFSLFLPAGERLEPAPAAAVAEGQAILPGGTETLLVIDDEELVRRSTARLFVSLGYRVLEAEDGLRGLDTFDRHREEIALVVLDLSMPGLSGRSVLRQLKARVPRLKVIVFTGYAAGAEEFAGLAQVVEKPFSVRRLAQIARQILDAG